MALLSRRATLWTAALAGGILAALVLIAAGWFLREKFVAYRCVADGHVWEWSAEGCVKRQYPRLDYRRHAAGNRIEYNFADGENTLLSGDCERQPEFAISGGNYPASPAIVVTIDGKITTITDELAGTPMVHGRQLLPLWNSPDLADKMAKARQSITIKVGNWQRSLKPAPELAFFVDECRRLRQRDPEAMGKNSDIPSRFDASLKP